MHKKHLLLPLTLLTPIQNKPFPSHRWMSAMMQEMEESFSHMRNLMEEASTESMQKSVGKDKDRMSMAIEKEPDHILLTISNINEGPIEAHFDENTVYLKHPDFNAQIRQMKDRYNRRGISFLLESKQSVIQEEDSKKMQHISYSSRTEHISLEKPLLIDEPEIMYDEEQKELTVKFIYKTNKKIPVNIKKTA
jgi:hypothetical protein